MTFLLTISKRTAKDARVIVALWATVAVVTTSQVWVFRQATGRPAYPVLRLYIMHLLEWLPWALLAIGCAYLARHRSWGPLRWRTVLLVFPPLGVALVVSKFCLEFWFTALHRGIPMTAELFSNTLLVFLATSFPLQILTAWVILGTGLLAPRPGSRQGNAPEPAEPAKYARRLTIRSSGRAVLVDVESIDRIDAADYYSEIHSGGTIHLAREPLSRLELKLDPRSFVRIHRSTIINVRRLRRLETRTGGDAEVVLHDGTRKRVSRSRRKALEQALSGIL